MLRLRLKSESHISRRQDCFGRLRVVVQEQCRGEFHFAAASLLLQQSSTSPSRLSLTLSAARHLRKACTIGISLAFRLLADIFYQFHTESSLKTAFDLYEQGALVHQDARSKFKLACCYEFGLGTAQNSKLAIQFYNEAADGGSGEAMATLGYLKLHGKLLPCNHHDAVRLLNKANSMNVLTAKELLASCYLKGIGVQRDPVQAFHLLRQVFDAGDFLCTADLAEYYDKGIGVQQDHYQATNVYRRCMNAGTWQSRFFQPYYGLRLVRGLGVKKDVQRGKELIFQSTKSGNAISWHALAECYRNGFGVQKNMRKAERFYRQAIRCENGVRGIVASYLALGEMLELGCESEVEPNIWVACKYYLQAALRLDTTAQWKVAQALESGIGLDKHVYRAVYYFRMCANAGNLQAQRKTVAYYGKGHGIERPVLAVTGSFVRGEDNGKAFASVP